MTDAAAAPGSTEAGAANPGAPTPAPASAVADPRRVAAVRATGLLDSEAEEAFDRLTRLAVRLVGVPAAFVSLVDAERDFYKSACGFGEPLASARELTGPTFCHFAVERTTPLVIPDTAADPAYRDVPTVRTLGVAAYVGIPLVAGGQTVGAFCAIDTRPRAWTAAEVEVLAELAASAQRELDLRAAAAAASAAAARLGAQQAELEASNQQLHELAAELEAQTEALQAAAADREAQRAVVEAAHGAAEAAYRTAEAERARATGILEATADAYFALDADFRIVAVNAAMTRATGLAREALLGRLMWDAFPGTAGTAFERHYRAAMAGAEAHFTRDYADARLDLVTEVDVYPGPAGADGRPGAAVFWRDVTARTRAEAERARLLAAERAARAAADRERARLAEVVGEMPAGVALTDGPAHRFVLANAAYVAAVGGRDVVGKTLQDAFPDLAGQGFHEAIARVYATGLPEHTPEVPATFREPDGTRRAIVIDLSLVPVRDAAGEIAGVLSFHVDATERVSGAVERARLLAELGAERERLRTVILQMPTPVALHEGPELRFTLANDAARRASGGRDATGLTPREAFPELDGQGLYERLARVYATGEPWRGSETPMRFDRDGTGVQDAWFDLRYEPVRDGAGQVTGVLQLAVDVTDQVRARREVERLLADAEEARAEAEAARAEAEAANRAKGEFLAVMSHELRTPLNAIGGYAELMDMGLHGPVSDAQRGALARVQAAQRRLLALINDVLNYARLESGRVEYALGVVDVREVIADVIPLLEPQLAAKGLTLDVRLPDGPCVVWTDREKLGQVLVNLLSNATKFTDARHPATGAPGRVTIAVATRRGAAADAVFLRVTDTGRGIPRAKQAAIFEPFVQVRADAGSAYAQATEGTGLGLAISRDLARGMDGDLRVRSREGEGAAFTVVLRRAAAPDGAARDRRTHEERRAEEERRSGEDRRADARDGHHDA